MDLTKALKLKDETIKTYTDKLKGLEQEYKQVNKALGVEKGNAQKLEAGLASATARCEALVAENARLKREVEELSVISLFY